MNINIHNCESYFLDYYEKNLSPVEVAEVLFFLEENPELKEVFESYKAIYIEHEKINFPDKESLKKKYSREELDAILSSNINRSNCEQFFIANAEGILSSSQKEKLNLFLIEYPEQKTEFELFQRCKLSAETISFEGKESLRRELITKENREEYFIRAIENDLNASEHKLLNRLLAKSPEFKKEFELFSQTILPVEAISFEEKSSLKRKERKPVFVSIFSQRTTYYAVAAAILLLAGLFLLFKNDETDKTFVADKTIPIAIGTGNKTIVNAKKENVEAPVKEKGQKSIPEIKGQSINHSSQPVANGQKQEAKKEEINLQPVIVENNDNMVAERENEKPKMMEEAIIAEKKHEEKTENEIVNQAIASAAAVKSNTDEYQTLGSFVRKKIKTALGIQYANPCEAEDKLTVWDLAMAAKNGIQNLIGTTAVDVNKACDGAGDKIEYVFTAGNFEISANIFIRDKSASK